MAKLPKAKKMGRLVNTLLRKALELWPSLEKTGRAMLTGEKVAPMDEKVVDKVRKSVLSLLGGEESQRVRTARASTPLQASIIGAWGKLVGDPDSETLISWLDHGAPLGYTQPIPTNGIFPVVDGGEWKEESLRNLARSLSGWTNYESAVQEAETLRELIDDYENRGFCHLCDTEEQAALELGTRPILNRLGVITKLVAGKKKSRVIWDLRESGANHHCSQGERIILPRLLDVATSVLEKYKRGEEPWLAAVDIKDAFMNIPAGKDKHVTCAAVPRRSSPGENDIVVFDTLVFGAVSSPTLWGRVASWLGRSWAAICPRTSFQIYVDDPAFVVPGDLPHAVTELSISLLWAAVAGFPIKWEKAVGGKEMSWVGAHLKISEGEQAVEVTIPTEKVAKIQDLTKEFLSKPVIGFRKLRSYAGSLSFVAGLIPHLRPFLSTVWGALGSACTANDGGGKSRLSGRLVHTRRVRPALLWVAALVRGEPAPLMRKLTILTPELEAEVVTDACPFGIGGVLRINNNPVSCFGMDIPDTALKRFKACRGDCKFNTVWEGLALLVAFRAWLPNLGFGAFVRCKSDNVGALVMLSKGKAKSPEMNILAREFALDQALQKYRLGWLKHIPGVTNLEADALSRLHAPIPATLPRSLADVDRIHINVSSSFWLVDSL